MLTGALAAARACARPARRPRRLLRPPRPGAPRPALPRGHPPRRPRLRAPGRLHRRRCAATTRSSWPCRDPGAASAWACCWGSPGPPGLRVAGLVDAAVAAASLVIGAGPCLHVDLTRHRAVVTSLRGGAERVRDDVATTEGAGSRAFEDRLLREIARTFVAEMPLRPAALRSLRAGAARRPAGLAPRAAPGGVLRRVAARRADGSTTPRWRGRRWPAPPATCNGRWRSRPRLLVPAGDARVLVSARASGFPGLVGAPGRGDGPRRRRAALRRGGGGHPAPSRPAAPSGTGAALRHAAARGGRARGRAGSVAMKRRRKTEVFGLSFLDCICCGFGATVLIYMILNSGQKERAQDTLGPLRAETNRLEEQVLEGQANLVELRNTLERVREDAVTTRGLSTRLIDVVKQSQDELATFERETIAQREHVNKLQADLRSLEEGNKRLSGGAPSREVPGDKVRAFVGDGDRQYLTGFKVGGKRVLFLVDASASMLADTVVNAVRRRLLPEADRMRADKWRRAVRATDWLTTQIPRESQLPDLRVRHRGAGAGAGHRGTLAGGPRPQVARRRGCEAAQHRAPGRHQPGEGLRRRGRAAARGPTTSSCSPTASPPRASPRRAARTDLRQGAAEAVRPGRAGASPGRPGEHPALPHGGRPRGRARRSGSWPWPPAARSSPPRGTGREAPAPRDRRLQPLLPGLHLLRLRGHHPAPHPHPHERAPGHRERADGARRGASSAWSGSSTRSGARPTMLSRELRGRREQLSDEQVAVARLQGDLSHLRGEWKASRELSQVQDILAGRMLAAQQELTEEMKRLQAEQERRPRADAVVAGIPADSEYVVFVIDTSGSMQRFAWSALLRKMGQTLDAYPRVKGLQVMNDEGVYMFPTYAGKWIPDTPGAPAGRHPAPGLLERLQQLEPGRGHRGRHPHPGHGPAEGQHLRAGRRVHGTVHRARAHDVDRLNARAAAASAACASTPSASRPSSARAAPTRTPPSASRCSCAPSASATAAPSWGSTARALEREPLEGRRLGALTRPFRARSI